MYLFLDIVPKPKRVKNGTYNVVVPKALKSYKKGEKKPKEINLFVKADGKNVGQRIKFRIKDVPDPVASIRKR
jgi:hypothetical protein